MLAGLAIEAGQDVGRSRDVVIDLAVLELVEQRRRETFRQAGLSPVDAVVPVAGAGGGRGILFEDGAGDVFLAMSRYPGTDRE